MALIQQQPYQVRAVLTFALLSAAFVAEVQAVPVGSKNVAENQLIQPQAKQGILEIPKRVATIIRNFLDSNIQSYLNITTPAPNPNKPDELNNSIIGHVLLGHLYTQQATAPPYTPQRPVEATHIQAITTLSNEPPVVDQAIEPPTSPSAPLEPGQTTKKPRVRTRRTTKAPVHILDTETSFSGIHNSYGTLLNGPEEVYWIPDHTKPSVIIPLEPSTAPTPAPIPATERTTVKTTTEGDDGGDEEEETQSLERNY